MGAIVLLVAILSPLINVMWGRLRKEDSTTLDEDKDRISSDVERPQEYSGNGSTTGVHPGISVVITVDDESESLRDNLPKWLSQKYDGEYQIVVVSTSNDPQVENILKLQSANPKLYTTFIPSSSRYMSRKKLAVTVGVKAAKYDWILLTDVDCHPVSDSCLSALSAKCSPSTDIILGSSTFDEGCRKSELFDYTYLLCRQMSKAVKGNTWGYSGKSLMFRKSMFINGKGFDGNLKYIRGEYEFIVNKYSSGNNTVVCTSDNGIMSQEPLSSKQWKNKVMNYLAIREQLKDTVKPRILFNLSMGSMILSNIITLGVCIYSVLSSLWILTAVSAIAFLLNVLLRICILRRSLSVHLPEISSVRLLWYEETLPFRNMMRLVIYRMTDKYDFISHKI